MAGQQAWHFEQVNIKDSEYAKKCGIAGECYFYVSKGHIKIAQLDNKTSLDLSVSRIRNWGATSKSFFLDLGSRSPAGAGRLEMTHKDPNTLRLLVRDTTSSKKHNKPEAERSDSTSGYGGEEDFDYAYVEDEESSYGQDASYHGGADSYHGRPDGYEAYPGSTKSSGQKGQNRKNSKGAVANQLMTEAAWHKKDKVRSEESEGAINVRTIGTSRRHVAVGDEMETYTVVKKDN